MAIPKQESMELPLLHEIEQAGGSARPKDVYDPVASHFPGLTEDDRKMETKTGADLFTNRVQFARKSLVQKGELDRSTYGVWTITQAGRDRLLKEWPDMFRPLYTDGTKLRRGLRRVQQGPGRQAKEPTNQTPGPRPAAPSLLPAVLTPSPIESQQPSDIRACLLESLRALDDAQFERFCGRLLEAMGFEDVRVTGRSHDRGIDGSATLRYLGLKVAFQAKNWQNNQVGGPRVREFRGSVVNRFSVGMYITTSSFTPGAHEEADEPGSPRLVLIDGSKLVDIMLEKGLGVHTVPVTRQEIEKGFFNSI